MILITVVVRGFEVRFPLLKGARMSTIGDVQAAEKKVNEIMEKLRNASPEDGATLLGDELRKATEEYSKAVLELKLP